MKMVIAIINYDDSQEVMGSLIKSGFSITKLPASGGLLKTGSVTMLIGLDESRLDECLQIIKEHSSTRKQIIPTGLDSGLFPTAPVEIDVGGATVFVINVERYEKL